jgi:hypothetical protein
MGTNNRERVENKETKGGRGRKEKRSKKGNWCLGNIHKHYVTKAVKCYSETLSGGGGCNMRTACKSSFSHIFCNNQSIHNVLLCNKTLIFHFSIITCLRGYKYQAKFKKN